MTEILWHGRGGQGAFTAAKVLGASYAMSGKYALAFPSFGPERRGAPVLAFTKLDKKAIGDRSQIKKADYVVFLDDTLFSENAFNEIKENGQIFVNSRKTPEEFGLSSKYKEKISQLTTFDGLKISQQILNLSVSNTAMLSLLVKKTFLITKDELINGIKLYLPSKIALKNQELVERIFGEEL